MGGDSKYIVVYDPLPTSYVTGNMFSELFGLKDGLKRYFCRKHQLYFVVTHVAKWTDKLGTGIPKMCMGNINHVTAQGQWRVW